jgi:hypothetical protein
MSVFCTPECIRSAFIPAVAAARRTVRLISTVRLTSQPSEILGPATTSDMSATLSQGLVNNRPGT